MGSSVTTLDGRSDAELISAVRAGDVAAYGELFARHVDAARRLGRQLVSSADVDDLVSESFAKVLGVLQRGGGPDLAFRAYLLTAVRRVHVDRIRAASRLHTTDDLTPFDPGVPFRDTAVEGFESAAAARAFASLPERWQLVLWHTEVESQKPAEVAQLLGMTPNAVSALAYRAREGLRQAYLTMHAADITDDACERTRGELGAYVRGGLARRDAARVEQHLEHCRPCTALYLELTEVNSNLRALLAPLLLGGAAAAYAASAGGGAVTGIAFLIDRAKDLVLAHGPTAAVAGAAASAVVAGAAITLYQQAPEPPSAGEPPVISSTPSVFDADPRPLRRASDPAAARRTTDADVSPDAPAAVPSTAPDPTGPPTPTSGPSEEPDPTGRPEPTDEPEPTEEPEPTTPPSEPPGTPTPVPTPPPTAGPPTAEPAPTRTPLVALSATASVGPGGVVVGLGLGLAGVPVIPPTTVGVPLPGSG
ncbi:MULTISPECIES: sigma-70 family RNA polymerase sigma factor [unclassified Nocardioides]|uniref:sigma-70 family RNA polymerase sigma factor n=1 Tax=unclassified Nocardioides TaxID=2615069 RepID=UPI00360B6A9B